MNNQQQQSSSFVTPKREAPQVLLSASQLPFLLPRKRPRRTDDRHCQYPSLESALLADNTITNDDFIPDCLQFPREILEATVASAEAAPTMDDFFSNPLMNLPKLSLKPRRPLSSSSVRPSVFLPLQVPTEVLLETPAPRRMGRRLSMKDATRVMEQAEDPIMHSSMHASIQHQQQYQPQQQQQHQVTAMTRRSLPRRLSLTSLSSHGMLDFPDFNLDFAGCA